MKFLNRNLLVIAFAAATTLGAYATEQNKPIAADAEFYGRQNTAANGNLNALVTAGTLPYLFASQGEATNGTSLVNSNGKFSFTPNYGATYGSFNYIVTDANGSSDEATVTIVIE